MQAEQVDKGTNIYLLFLYSSSLFKTPDGGKKKGGKKPVHV